MKKRVTWKMVRDAIGPTGKIDGLFVAEAYAERPVCLMDNNYWVMTYKPATALAWINQMKR